MTENHRNPNHAPEANNDPDWIVKTPKGYGRKARLQRIGVAWNRTKDGGICIRTSGTQIIADDIYLFPITAETEEQNDA